MIQSRQKRYSRKLFPALAAKNLLRHRRRTAITAIAIGVGIAIFVATDSIMGGFAGEANRNLKEFEYGSAALFAPGYWEEQEKRPLDRLIESPTELLAELDSDDIEATPRTMFRGDLIVHYDPFPEDGSMPLNFTAVDPERDPQVFRLRESIVEGRFVESGEEIILGRWLADRLGAEIGYTVSVTTRTRDGFRQLMDLEIVGIYQTFNPEVDRHTAYVPMDVAEYYLEMDKAVTGIFTSLPERHPGEADLEPVQQAVERSGQSNSVELLGFDDMNRTMNEVLAMQEAVTNVLLLILAIIAIIGITNTMLMSVLERQAEIGMLRALGMRPGEIRKLFMLEAAGIGVIGGALGMILGSALVWIVSSVGIDYSFLLDEVDIGYRIEGVLYGVWNPITMLYAALIAILIAGIAAVLPTRGVLRQGISRCLQQ